MGFLGLVFQCLQGMCERGTPWRSLSSLDALSWPERRGVRCTARWPTTHDSLRTVPMGDEGSPSHAVHKGPSHRVVLHAHSRPRRGGGGCWGHRAARIKQHFPGGPLGLFAGTSVSTHFPQRRGAVSRPGRICLLGRLCHAFPPRVAVSTSGPRVCRHPRSRGRVGGGHTCPVLPSWG